MHPFRRFRKLLPLLCVAWLAGCSQVPEPIPEQTLTALTGKWQQIDGPAVVQFYDDESIKFSRPDEQPPFRVLTILENMKEGVGFSIGDRWSKPVEVKLDESGTRLTLVLPGEPEELLHFARSK